MEKPITLDELKTFKDKGYWFSFEKLWESDLIEGEDDYFHEYEENSDGLRVWNPGTKRELFQEIIPLDYTVGDCNYPTYRGIFYDEEVSYEGRYDDDFIEHMKEYGYYTDDDFDFFPNDVEIYLDEETKNIHIIAISS